MQAELNYKHLYYFWVAAKEGGMSHAAARLGMAVQTVSAQVRLLEQSLGHSLFKPAGRGLALTDAGHTALKLAEQIFLLGEQLPGAVRDTATQTSVRLVVGISDGLPKLAVRDLLGPVMDEPNLRLMCHEDDFDDLLADLALHRLDVVLSDRPAPANPNLRLYSHALGHSPLGWYAPPLPAEPVPGAGAAAHGARLGAPAAGPVVRAARCRATHRGRVRRQRLAGHLRIVWHGRLPGARAHARAAGERVRPEVVRALRRCAGTLLRHRHRAQGAAPAGAEVVIKPPPSLAHSV